MANKKTLITEKYQGYLTRDAIVVITNWKTLGLDEDLALACLELLWPENEIYELEPDDGP